MTYIKSKIASYNGLGQAATPGATAVAAGSGIIAAPQEAPTPVQSMYPGFPPGYYPGFPGYMPGIMPSQAPPTIMRAPAMPTGAGNATTGMKIPTKVELAKDRRKLFRRPVVRQQLGRLGTICAVGGLILLLMK